MQIYLAGGMRPRPREEFRHVLDAVASVPFRWSWLEGREELCWAEIVMNLLPAGHQVFDPRMNGTKVFEDYSFLDLLELRRADLVIAYLEETNPSGMGLAAEIAYAKGLGKTVLLINEKEDRYTRFIENFADRVFYTLQDAVPVISRIRP